MPTNVLCEEILLLKSFEFFMNGFNLKWYPSALISHCWIRFETVSSQIKSHPGQILSWTVQLRDYNEMNTIWNDVFLFILMIAAKNSFIFNKHNLATLEIMNIPLLIRLPGLISLSEFLFKMPILAKPYPTWTLPEPNPCPDFGPIWLIGRMTDTLGWYFGTFPRLFPKKFDSGTWSAWLVSLQSWSGWLNPSFVFVKIF